METKAKVLIGLLVLFVVIAAGVLAYTYSSPNQTTPVTGGGTTGGGTTGGGTTGGATTGGGTTGGGTTGGGTTGGGTTGGGTTGGGTTGGGTTAGGTTTGGDDTNVVSIYGGMRFKISSDVGKLICIDNNKVSIAHNSSSDRYSILGGGSSYCSSVETYTAPSSSQITLERMATMTFTDDRPPAVTWKDFAYDDGEIAPGNMTVFTFAGIRFKIKSSSETRPNVRLVGVDNSQITIQYVAATPEEIIYAPVAYKDRGFYNVFFGNTVLCTANFAMEITSNTTADQVIQSLKVIQSNNFDWKDGPDSISDWRMQS